MGSPSESDTHTSNGEVGVIRDSEISRSYLYSRFLIDSVFRECSPSAKGTDDSMYQIATRAASDYAVNSREVSSITI
jgi:hypothetical protein